MFMALQTKDVLCQRTGADVCIVFLFFFTRTALNMYRCSPTSKLQSCYEVADLLMDSS